MRSLKTSLLSMLIALSFTASLAHAEGDGKTNVKVNTDTKDVSAAQQKVEGKGFTEEAKQVKATTSNWLQLGTAARTAGADVPGINLLQELDSAASYYSNLHGTCVKTQATASWLCREKTSPELQKTLNNINTVASMITGVAVQDACSNLAKIARLAQAGLTAYTAACSSARAACEASCDTVKTNLDRIKKIVDSSGATLGQCQPIVPTNAAAATACTNYMTALKGKMAMVQQTVEKDSAMTGDAEAEIAAQSIAMKDKACTYAYGNMLVSAGAGIASMISSFKQGQQCDEESDGTGTDVATTATVDKCADATTAANDPECICKANPRTPGCSNSYQKANDGTTSRLASQGAELGTAGNGAGANTLPGIESDPLAGLRDLASTSAGGSDSSGIGAPTGGGSGLSGFGGGSGGGAGAQGEAAKKGLNTDILSGAGGGGGGGGFGGFKGSDPKLRQYLPGGAKDPSQGLAGQQAWKNEVTGQGGKSNWEKIKERYRDNKNTLLNN
ncbi:hypothetical protein [Bdellovibrio bacteriovorus]|uniref:Uncharacterized protein n=1 Tax=Bdellovibrio bacteriovorus str. Tiberius TaxID=1069642 RepID=K7Z6L5_BDEBC|nr:hypothetical protein [Bdellovibrio bacteriovorus]AFX99848.1 hypothetical protein Bdt_0139 [Bdellovibrio bacteriovorus str. Tiberius]